MKQKKGISLIVLIITIIIMIIISGAIILTLTETNIIDQAETAVNKYNETELKQRVGLVFTEAQMAKYTDLEYSIEDNLKTIFEDIYGKDNITVAKSGKNYKVNVKDSKTTFRIKPDGNIQEYEEMDPTNVYARLDDEGVLHLRATEKEGYNIYTDYTSIQSAWNTAGDATPASVVKIVIEEKIAPTSANSMFFTFYNLEEIENIQNLHTENITSMSNMFCVCQKLKSIDLSSFDTSKVNSMSRMFFGCNVLGNIDVSNFNTANVLNFNEMFVGCNRVTSLDLSRFDTSRANSMKKMFGECSSLKNVNLCNFDTSNISGNKMATMFYKCTELESIDLSSFNIENVTSLENMFAYCTKLKTINISSFDTRNVTSLYATFFQCNSLEKLELGNKFVISEAVNLDAVLNFVPSDIKITATAATRDKLISASSLTADNFEIIN